MKVLTVLGARPQFVKSGPVSAALEAAGIEEVLVHTGQHYDRAMSQIFFDELRLRIPDINLNAGSGSHGVQTGVMLAALDPILISARPDCVLVYGDTNSTLAGALAASKMHIPVAHVEAGLRSFNRRMPEEINRVVTDCLSTLLLTPTETAVRNLVAEGVEDWRIQPVGDVMYDAVLRYGNLVEGNDTSTRLGLHGQEYLLVTVHRAENTDNPERLRAILSGLSAVSAELRVVWPVHPRTRKALCGLDSSGSGTQHIEMIEPLGYLEMLQLERRAAVIVTDSGGVQKEAFFFRTPCVTLRDETEWTELIELGWNVLCPPSRGPAAIALAIRDAYRREGDTASPYGDGNASTRIAEAILRIADAKPCEISCE